jgi:hypothetical protein
MDAALHRDLPSELAFMAVVCVAVAILSRDVLGPRACELERRTVDARIILHRVSPCPRCNKVAGLVLGLHAAQRGPLGMWLCGQQRGECRSGSRNREHGSPDFASLGPAREQRNPAVSPVRGALAASE